MIDSDPEDPPIGPPGEPPAPPPAPGPPVVPVIPGNPAPGPPAPIMAQAARAEERRNIRGVDVPEWTNDPDVDRLGARGWTQRIEICKTIGLWTSETTAQYAGMALKGDAGEWYQGLLDRNPPPYEATHWDDETLAAGIVDNAENRANLRKGLKSKFLSWFDYEVSLADRSAIMDSLVQKDNESVRRFHDRCVNGGHLLCQDFPELQDVPRAPEGAGAAAAPWPFLATVQTQHSSIAFNWTMRNIFLHGLRDSIKKEVIAKDPTTMEELLKAAITVEKSLVAVDKKMKGKAPLPEIHAVMTEDVATTPDQATEQNKFEELVNLIKGSFNRPNNSGRGRGRGRGSNRGRGPQGGDSRCYYCHRPNHMALECRAKKDDVAKGQYKPWPGSKWANANNRTGQGNRPQSQGQAQVADVQFEDVGAYSFQPY